jgi:hypothetical protein
MFVQDEFLAIGPEVGELQLEGEDARIVPLRNVRVKGFSTAVSVAH